MEGNFFVSRNVCSRIVLFVWILLIPFWILQGKEDLQKSYENKTWIIRTMMNISNGYNHFMIKKNGVNYGKHSTCHRPLICFNSLSEHLARSFQLTIHSIINAYGNTS